MKFFILFIITIFNFCDSTANNIDTHGRRNMSSQLTAAHPIDILNLAQYIASIQPYPNIIHHFGWFHFCGGAIIGEKKILTAAHCVAEFGATDIVVVVGIRNRFTLTDFTRIKEVESIIKHNNFEHITMGGDVALLILKEDITLDNPQAAVIELVDEPYLPRQICTIMGWGRIFYGGPTSSELGFAYVKLISYKNCKRIYGDNLLPGMLCAGDVDFWRRDTCEGDSGGPLICKRKIQGIVSWGVGCGLRYYPGVYTDVYYYKRWIETNRSCRIKPVIVLFLIKIILLYLLIYYSQ